MIDETNDKEGALDWLTFTVSPELQEALDNFVRSGDEFLKYAKECGIELDIKYVPKV